jgi:hypothetical protein
VLNALLMRNNSHVNFFLLNCFALLSFSHLFHVISLKDPCGIDGAEAPVI